jgi:hypothetical protein
MHKHTRDQTCTNTRRHSSKGRGGYRKQRNANDANDGGGGGGGDDSRGLAVPGVDQMGKPPPKGYVHPIKE